MLRQVEGSRAVAETVALCRPEVICAYPISPQTHIVENLSALVKAGELAPCEFVNVESEFAAMSVAIGASATGARAYTATASQGLLYMVEALYNASGLGLPIVMTVANRAIGAPINIWNDHSDSMSQRDCGWIQLYAETNQEAADLHVQAFRLAEELSTPVMVCMDGFILTHAVERIDIPDQATVDAFLPPFQPRQVLDPAEPVSIGAMVGPEAFMEVKYLAHAKQMQALELIPEIAANFAQAFGRDSGGLIRSYRADDAETIVVALGSVLGTIQDTVDELRDEGVSIGAVGITSFRPFPLDALRAALGHAQRVVVLEKALAVGIGGIVTANVRMALAGIAAARLHRDRGPRRAADHQGLASLVCSTKRWHDRLEPLTFLDMDWDIVNRELARMGASRTSGPHAENILRDVGAGRGGPGMSESTSMTAPAIRFYQTGSLAVGNRLLDPDQRSVQADKAADELDHLRPSRLPGLRRGARRALRAGRRDARHEWAADRGQRDRLSRGVLHALSGDLVADPVDPLAVRECAGRVDRYRRGAAREGPRPTCASSARVATAAPWTSASPAFRGCSNATTTCSTSATTTRRT